MKNPVPEKVRHDRELRLQSQASAVTATKTILSYLLDIMMVSEEGIRFWENPEYLHDFRVALRRTRTVLSQMMEILPPQVIINFSAEFSWLGKVTGPVRDLDVLIVKIQDYLSTLETTTREDLQPFLQFLYQQKIPEHEKLIEALDSTRYRHLIYEWREFLQLPPSQNIPSLMTARPIADIARNRIKLAYRKVRTQGRKIDVHSTSAMLHKLRMSCKELRYLMDFFQDLYPEKKIKKLIKQMKVLQEDLGTTHDAEVQEKMLIILSQRMREQFLVAQETVSAIDTMRFSLKKSKQNARVSLENRFIEFISKQNRKRFKSLVCCPIF